MLMSRITPTFSTSSSSSGPHIQASALTLGIRVLSNCIPSMPRANVQVHFVLIKGEGRAFHEQLHSCMLIKNILSDLTSQLNEHPYLHYAHAVS